MAEIDERIKISAVCRSRSHASARHRDVGQATIDELLSLFRVHMNEDAISCLPLAAVTRHRVAIIQMRILSNVKCDGVTGVETDSEVTTLVDLLDRAQLTAKRARVIPFKSRGRDGAGGGNRTHGLGIMRPSLCH